MYKFLTNIASESITDKNLAIANRSRVSCAHNWLTIRRVIGRWILS